MEAVLPNLALDSVRVDCSAFTKSSDGKWLVTKDTTVLAGLNDQTAGRLQLPGGHSFGPNTYRPNGVDLVDVLNTKCGS